MIKVPPVLLNRFGTPEIHGDTYVWRVQGGPSDDKWVWKPSWHSAWNRHRKGESIPVAFGLSVKLASANKGMALNLIHHPWPETWTVSTGDALSYLESRGLTAEEIAAYTVSDTSKDGFAVFPIVEDGKLVGWQGRSIYAHGPKCISSSAKDGWNSGRKLVFGLDRLYPGETAYVSEGVFDCLMFGHGVATLGSALTDTKVVKILDRKPSGIVILAQNKDPASTAETRARMFRSFTKLDVKIAYPPSRHEDWGVMLRLRKDEDEDVVQG